MSKAKKEAIAPTAEQQAEMDAQRIVDIRKQMEDLDAELSLVQERLLGWATENGKTELFGKFNVVERQNAPKLVGATGKLLEMHTEKLLAELDAQYVSEKKSLDIKRIAAALDSDPALAALLKVKGLSIVQESSTSLRKI